MLWRLLENSGLRILVLHRWMHSSFGFYWARRKCAMSNWWRRVFLHKHRCFRCWCWRSLRWCGYTSMTTFSTSLPYFPSILLFLHSFYPSSAPWFQLSLTTAVKYFPTISTLAIISFGGCSCSLLQSTRYLHICCRYYYCLACMSDNIHKHPISSIHKNCLCQHHVYHCNFHLQ